MKSRAAWVLALAIGLAASAARAADQSAPPPPPPTTSDAEALFRAGKMLLGQHDYARACQLLTASVQVEEATGALLALAICHEGEGKLASAAAEYQRVADRSRDDGRGDRATVAVERGALLKPRLSTLAVAPAAAARDLPGLSIACNGGVIERADWGAVVPRDGGTYVIIASAPGKKPWRGRVSLAASADHQTVAVPVLDPGEAVPAPAATATSATVAPAPAPMATAALPAPAPAAKGPPPNAGVLVGRPASDAVPAQPRTSALRRTGIALIGAGAAALAVSSFYGLRAMNQNNQSSRDGCVGDVCNPTGKSARLAALSSGRTSTIFGIAGVAAAASGIAAFIWGGRSSAGTAVGARARHVAWSVDPALDHVLLSVVFTGGVTP